MDLTFRAAQLEDVPAIVRLLRDDVLGRRREQLDGAVDDAYRSAFAEIEEDGRQLLAVAEHAGKVVGTLQITFIRYLTYHGGERAQIEAVRVDTSHRGGGIGRKLVEWAIDVARQRGCHMVQLTTNKQRSDAHRFYGSLGFDATHEGMKLHL